MRLLVLSARPDLEVNRRLLAAASAAGLDLGIVDGAYAVADMAGAPALPELGVGPAWPPAAVLARVGSWRPDSVLALLESAVADGAATPNPAAAIRLGRDHWRTVLALRAAGLPTPGTLAGADPQTMAAAAVERLGLPVVVKMRRSRMGIGVMRCDRRDHLEAVLDSMWRLGEEIVVQRFIDSKGASLRVLVVGGEVVAAARFQAGSGEWRSNAARGGRVTAHRPSDHESSLALAAAAAIGLGVCGIDLLPTPGGTWVGEVNPTPGFLALEAATTIDIARCLVDHLAACAARMA